MESEENKDGSRPPIPKIQPLQNPSRVTAISTFGILLLATFYTFYFAREFFLPVVLAIILSLLLKPLVRGFSRVKIPEACGAAIILALVLVLFGAGILLLSGPASNWVKRAPESFAKVEVRIRSIMTSAEKITRAAETVEELTDSDGVETPKVELKKPGLLNNVWNQTKGFVIIALEVFVLLYFFLAVGDAFTLKLIQILPRLEDKKKAVGILREVEHGVSQYLVSVTLVNLFEGTLIGIGLAILGMPNPLLWGVLAFFANYIPYLGALIAGSIVTIVAVVSFDSVGRALIAPAIYFGVNIMDNFIAPYVMGKRLTLNPVIVFLAVMFWGWIWGIPGVLLAVPITMTLKILCDHVPTLAPFSEFITAVRSEKPEGAEGTNTEFVQGNA